MNVRARGFRGFMLIANLASIGPSTAALAQGTSLDVPPPATTPAQPASGTEPKPGGGAPGSEAAPSKPAGYVFPDKLKRVIAPRNESGEKVVTFPLGLYDETTDARIAIREALGKANKENKRVLVVFGENNCGFCAWLHDLFVEDGRLKNLLASDYVCAFVDLGKWNKNMDLMQSYGLNPQDGAPAMAVLDAKTGFAVGQKASKFLLLSPMTTTAVFDANKTLDYLQAMKVGGSGTDPLAAPAQPKPIVETPPSPPPAPDADTLIAQARTAAAGEKKRVLILFRGIGQQQSIDFENWLNDPAIKPIIGRDLVIQPLDVDKNAGARQSLELYSGQMTTSLPWFIVVEPGGRMVTQSRVKGVNIGFPKADADIEAIMGVLRKAAPSVTDDEAATIAESLKAKMTAPPTDKK